MIPQFNVKEVRADMKRRYQSVGVMTGMPFYDWVARMFPKNLYAVEEDRPKRLLSVPVLAEPSDEHDALQGYRIDGEARESTSKRPTSVGGGEQSPAIDGHSCGGQKPFDRKAYMKDYMEDYRKKPVVCPNCGHTFKELKRVKE